MDATMLGHRSAKAKKMYERLRKGRDNGATRARFLGVKVVWECERYDESWVGLGLMPAVQDMRRWGRHQMIYGSQMGLGSMPAACDMMHVAIFLFIRT